MTKNYTFFLPGYLKAQLRLPSLVLLRATLVALPRRLTVLKVQHHTPQVPSHPKQFQRLQMSKIWVSVFVARVEESNYGSRFMGLGDY